MPAFVHTILVHRYFVPLHFVHAIFCPNIFSPKILCHFNFCLPSFFSKHSWYFNILVDEKFCLIDIYYSPIIILCPISFFYGAILSQAHVSILVLLCPTSSYFRNSFTKPLFTCPYKYVPFLSIVHIIIDPLHTHSTLFNLEVTDVITIMLVHQWPRPIFFDLICIDFHVC